VLFADLDRVAEAFGCDQRRRRALALDDGIGDERRAVHDLARLLWRQAGFGERLRQPLGNGAAGIVRRRERLANVKRAALGVKDQQVGEGPADIDADPQALPVTCHPRSPNVIPTANAAGRV
jgi:hypothetical protein